MAAVACVAQQRAALQRPRALDRPVIRPAVPPPLGCRRPLLQRTSVSRGKTSTTCLAAPPPFRENDSSSEGAVAVAAPPLVAAMEPSTKQKTRVVILGSGWGAVSVVKNIAPEAFGPDGKYELTLVSPRNYMVFTPLLPSAVGGVVSESSIVESIRNIMRGKGIYYEAKATDIDPVNRTLTCVKEFCEVCAMRRGSGGSAEHHTEEDHTLTIPYDILICSVGAVNATFGIPGVQEHCWFLKTMDDAQKLRRHISKTVEHAALPDASEEERRRMLSFLVVGGGPTGCEIAAELHDLIVDDVKGKLPQIEEEISITLVDGLDSLLCSFDPEIQKYASKSFGRMGIDVRLGRKVTAVHAGHIDMELKDGTKESLDYGTCVWAAGVTVHPLVAKLKAKLPAEVQDSRRGLVVDENLRVKGTQGTIFCIGDAAVTPKGLPPTAQVARQEGEYLAALLSSSALALAPDVFPGHDLVPLPPRTRPFRYFHLGSLAYLGEQKGVMDLPFKLPFLRTLKGYLGAQTWRFLETFMQVSPRTRWLVANDWLRVMLFGRNISDI